MNIIYKITNEVNGKAYIGLTTQGLLQRKREHVSRFKSGKRDHKLYLAFRKYGIDTFSFEEYVCALDKDSLKQLEIDAVKEYDSYNNGYNMTVGGDMVSEETSRKISAKLKGRKLPWADKIVAARRANNTYGTRNSGFIVKTPNGRLYGGKNISAFCRKFNLDPSNLLKTLLGKASHCKDHILIATFND